MSEWVKGQRVALVWDRPYHQVRFLRHAEVTKVNKRTFSIDNGDALFRIENGAEKMGGWYRVIPAVGPDYDRARWGARIFEQRSRAAAAVSEAQTGYYPDADKVSKAATELTELANMMRLDALIKRDQEGWK